MKLSPQRLAARRKKLRIAGHAAYQANSTLWHMLVQMDHDEMDKANLDAFLVSDMTHRVGGLMSDLKQALAFGVAP